MSQVCIHCFNIVAIALTSQQIIRVIFSQDYLKRADGEKGRLKSATLRPDDAPVGLSSHILCFLIQDPTVVFGGIP